MFYRLALVCLVVFGGISPAVAESELCKTSALVQTARHRVHREVDRLSVQECPPVVQTEGACTAAAEGIGFINATESGTPGACILWQESGNLTLEDMDEAFSSMVMDSLATRCKSCLDPSTSCEHLPGISCYQGVTSAEVSFYAQCHQNCPEVESWACNIFWDTPDSEPPENTTEALLALSRRVTVPKFAEGSLSPTPDKAEGRDAVRGVLSQVSSVQNRSLLSFRDGRARSSSRCWGSVVDSAICGFNTITDGAICGWNEGKKCKYGRRRRWSGFKGCDFWKTAKNCKVAASCDVSLDVPSCLGDLFQEVSNPYREYAEYISNTGCNSVSSCKNEVEDGLADVWELVYSSTQSGILNLMRSGTEQFGVVAPTLVARAKQSAGTILDGLDTATSEVREFLNGVFGSFQKHDLGQVCTPTDVGFWYYVPTDCGFFEKFGNIFSSPSAADSNWADAVDRLRECTMKTGAFDFPTPFLDFRVQEFCLPTEVQTPIEYILGVFKFGANGATSLVSHFETIAAKVQSLVSSSGLDLMQIGQEMKTRRDAQRQLALGQTRGNASSGVWHRCACEGRNHPTNPDCGLDGTCRCNGQVRYGYGNQWYTLTASGSIQCSNSVFGDPFKYQGKECQCLADQVESGSWERCACASPGHATFPSCTHSPTCNCNGQVRFGYGDKWSTSMATGDIQCSTGVMGDPDPGQAKECQCFKPSVIPKSTWGLQVSTCFDWSFVAFSFSLCIGLLFGEKDGEVVLPNLVMDVEFGATSFYESALEKKEPEAGFSLDFDFKEEYPAFLPASEPRWGVAGSMDVALAGELEGISQVGGEVGVTFLPDPTVARGYSFTLMMGTDSAGEEAQASLLSQMQEAAQQTKTKALSQGASATEAAALMAAVGHMAKSKDFDRMLETAVLPGSDQLLQALDSAATKAVPPVKLEVSVSAEVSFSFCLTPPVCNGQ